MAIRRIIENLLVTKLHDENIAPRMRENLEFYNGESPEIRCLFWSFGRDVVEV